MQFSYTLVVLGLGSRPCSCLSAAGETPPGESPSSATQMPAAARGLSAEREPREHEVTARERRLTSLGSCDCSDAQDTNKDLQKTRETITLVGDFLCSI